ncbi:MAG: hypothetical protein AAFQ79_07445 [Pseudomonadota bacterium]
MTACADTRGAALVGTLSSLSAWEAAAVIHLRLWCSGPAGQVSVWNRYAKCFGPKRAQAEMRAFEGFVHLLASNAHRPLVRKALGCRCICADEAVFLHLVKTATDGDLHEAAGAAALMVRAAHAEQAALLAAEVGQSVKAISRNAPQAAAIGDPVAATDNIVRLH